MSEDKVERTAEAPHGYGPDGAPLAPFGYKADGTPRRDGRGRPVGGGRVAAPKKRSAPKKPAARGQTKRSKEETRHQLVELAGMLTAPVVAFADSEHGKKRLGADRACALAGAAFIVDAHAEPGADALIQLAQTKPGVLAWMDTVEEKAPYLGLVQVGFSMTRALVANFMRPDPRLAEAARASVRARSERLATAVQAEMERAAEADRAEDAAAAAEAA